jgi:hypothetical protein
VTAFGDTYGLIVSLAKRLGIPLQNELDSFKLEEGIYGEGQGHPEGLSIREKSTDRYGFAGPSLR